MAEKTFLFKIRSINSVFRDYPELRETKEFSKLTPKQMCFVILYACETSELVNMKPENEKLEKCVKKTFGAAAAPQERARYLAGEFPAIVITAIEKMRSYNPDARSRSKAILLSVFDKLEAMIDIGVTDLKKMEVEEKRKYSELLIKIAESQQSLITQIERGFGISNEEDDQVEISAMEQAIEGETD